MHLHVAPLLERVGDWPMVGSASWQQLDDDDPVKLASIYDAAQHWALRVETCQEARCEASREVSDAVDWSALATEIRQRREVHIPREVAS